ncbi:MAG: DUF362 domain-containing protein [Polyangiaceae bacterium]|nr:DUF362 domain-containing protein [Polyangiaceae bacterium]
MLRIPDTHFPKLLDLTQSFPPTPALDARAVLRGSWNLDVRPGAKIAIAVGSRGISRLDEVVREVIQLLRDAGAEPFIVPAMGSHGGATAEGQAELLAGYGISEQALGVPVRASMEATLVGQTADGVPVHLAAEALRADGILVVCRVKPHTEFRGPIESGIMKMIAVGLGKELGATAFHVACQRVPFPKVLQTVARVKLEKAPFIGSVALIENQRHELQRIEVVRAEAIEQREPELLNEARALMPQLPTDDVDLLIVDYMGKNISGAGIDPNVIGRDCFGYFSSLIQEPTRKPFIRRIFVRDLTPETHGNAVGIGVADFATSRLVRAIDYPTMYMNTLTSQAILAAKIPIHFETDKDVLAHALATLALPDTRTARVIRIRDSLSLGNMQVSEAIARELSGKKNIALSSAPKPFAFDSSDNLLPLGAHA